MSNVQVVEDVYAAFNRGDVRSVLGMFDPNIEWRLAEGHPYEPEGKPWFGTEAVKQKFFMRAGGDWDGFTILPKEFYESDGTVIVECRYTGAYKVTGKSLDIQVCHLWKVDDGKVKRFQQYIDTAQLQEVMQKS